MNKLAAVSAILVLSVAVQGNSCGGDGELEVIDNVYDPCAALVLEVTEPTPARIAAVEAAAVMWNERSGSRLTVQDVVDAPRLEVEFDDAASAFHGLYDDEDPRVYVNTKLAGSDLIITLAHELGHAFGLYHVEEEARTSVMNKGNLEHEVNAGDVEDLMALWGECPLPDEILAPEVEE